MSTEKNADEILLHHSITSEAAAGASGGDDFMAAFNGDDEADAPQGQDAAAQDDPAVEVEQDGQDEQAAAEGVDTPENGEQGAPQEQQGVVLDDLPESVRQQVESILEANRRLAEEAAQRERDFRALHNRVAPVQRELDIAKQELAKRSTSAPPPQQPDVQSPSLAAVQAQFESAEWKEYERLYPDDAALQKRNQIAIAQAMDAQVARLAGAIESQAERISRLDRERAAAQQQREIEALSQAHPDWQELNESDEFWAWFESKEHLFGFRDEADRQHRLNNRMFVSDLLDMFKVANKPVGAPAPTQPEAGHQPRPASAALALAASPRSAGTGIRRPTGAPSPGDEFLAGYNS